MYPAIIDVIAPVIKAPVDQNPPMWFSAKISNVMLIRAMYPPANLHCYMKKEWVLL